MGSCDGTHRRRLRLRWHRVCRAGRSCKDVAPGSLGGQRHCVRGSYLLRTFSAPELASFGSPARSIGRRARSIRACCRGKHPLAVTRIQQRAPASPATRARTLAAHYSAAGISRRTRCKLGLGACLVRRLGKAALWSDTDVTVRGGAFFALGKFKVSSEELTPFLRQALHDKSAYVRSSAILGLTNVPVEASQVVPDLVAALNDPDVQVRQAATNALLMIKPEAAAGAGLK